MQLFVDAKACAGCFPTDQVYLGVDLVLTNSTSFRRQEGKGWICFYTKSCNFCEITNQFKPTVKPRLNPF